MGTHKPAYIVNIKFIGEKSQEEVTDAYNQFYVGVVSRMLKSSPLSIEEKKGMLDAIIKKYTNVIPAVGRIRIRDQQGEPSV